MESGTDPAGRHAGRAVDDYARLDPADLVMIATSDEAIETFKLALELEPTYVDLHYRLGLLYTDRRMFEDAVRHMEIAAEGAPDNEQIRASLALALQNMGLTWAMVPLTLIDFLANNVTAREEAARAWATDSSMGLG